MVSREAPPSPVQPLHRAVLACPGSVRATALVATVLVAIAVVAVVGLAAAPGHGSSAAPRRHPASTTPQAAPPSPVVSWLARSLPHDTAVLTDPTTAGALTDLGFSPVLPAAAGARAVRFVVSTPVLRATAGTYPAVAAALRGSVPVAEVESSGGELSVRQVSGVTASDLRDDATTRLQAERQLLANPSVTTGASDRAVLQAGGLDLRAATVLVLIAATQPVEVVAVHSDPAEDAAGRPARSVDVRVGSVPQLRTQLALVPSRWRVGSVEPQPDGSVRLTWPVDVTPVR